jgi:hypothetical protein
MRWHSSHDQVLIGMNGGVSLWEIAEAETKVRDTTITVDMMNRWNQTSLTASLSPSISLVS